MAVIDIHAHLFSADKPLPAAALRDPMWDVSDRIGPGFRLKAEQQALPRIESYLEVMDEAGIDVVCVNNVAMTAEGARAINEFNAEIIAMYPGRMVGLAAVPLDADEDGARELEYAVESLGFLGGKIYPKMQDVPLDAPTMRPVYEAAAELGVPLLTHTTPFLSGYSGVRGLDWMDHSYDNPGRLLDSGYMEEIPNLKIIFAHLGGGLAYYKEALVTRRPELESVFDRVYLDIAPAVAHSARAVQEAVAAVGQDHVFFGTDYPWIKLEDVKKCVAHVRDMGLTDETQSAVLGSGAMRVLRLDNAQ